MLSYDYPKTNNPFEIAQFIFQNIQRGDVLGIYKSFSDDNWPVDTKAWILSKSCKITDVILDNDKNNNIRRSFIFREPFILKKDNCPPNLDNKAVLYRYTIVKLLVKGYGICVNFNSCSKKNRKVVEIDASKWLKDMGYLNYRFTFDEYVIEQTENYIMNITEYLKDCNEVYENELLDIKYMIDYFYHVVTCSDGTSWPTYYILKQNFEWVFNAKVKVYKESDFEKSKKFSQLFKTLNSTKVNLDVKSDMNPEDNKEDNKSEDNFNMKSNVKSNNLKFNTDTFNKFNVGDIVEDYKGNIGYISEIIAKNIILYNKTVKIYRYKWQPLYIESNELNLKTPISLFYKRIGTHIFITRENEEQVAKRREALQKAHRFRREANNLGECCKKLSKDIENPTEKFLANNTKSIESAKKVTEQIRNVVKNVKTFTPDDFNNVKPIATKVVNTKTTDVKSTDVKSIEQTGEFENLNKYLKTDNNSPSILHDTPTHDTPTHDTPTHDTPTLPKKLYFNTSEYDITSNGNYNEKKEEALCNTINDIIEFLRCLE